MGILRTHLEAECDPRLAGELAYSIKEAYRFLWELIDTTPVLRGTQKCERLMGISDKH